MPAVTPEHIMVMNRRSAEFRSERRRQREALRGLPPRDLVPALLDPTPELASYRLKTIFTGQGRSANRGVIPMLSTYKFRRILTRLRSEGHQWADGETRLRSLSHEQRRWLMAAVLEFAPESWREAA